MHIILCMMYVCCGSAVAKKTRFIGLAQEEMWPGLKTDTSQENRFLVCRKECWGVENKATTAVSTT